MEAKAKIFELEKICGSNWPRNGALLHPVGPLVGGLGTVE